MSKEDKMNIYEKIQKARIALQHTAIKKSGLNKFAGFRYFELGDLLPHINNIFDDLGLFSAFNIKDNLASLTIVDTESPEATAVQFTSPIADASVKGTTPVQSLGAVHTYLKRYLYLNALEIIENDTLDANVGTGRLATEDPAKKEAILKKIDEYIAAGEPERFEEMKTQANDKYGLTDWRELPLASLMKVLGKLGAENV